MTIKWSRLLAGAMSLDAKFRRFACECAKDFARREHEEIVKHYQYQDIRITFVNKKTHIMAMFAQLPYEHSKKILGLFSNNYEEFM